MLPCSGCGYRKEVPGSAHIGCSFNWPDAVDDVRLTPAGWIAAVPARCAQRFIFPWNYDPVWGPDECPVRAEKADPAWVYQATAMDDLIAILGRRAL